jgi:hypothetical protein
MNDIESARNQLKELSLILSDELKRERQSPDDLEMAGNLIDSLKQDLAHETNRNIKLQKEIEQLKNEYVSPF